MATFNNPFGIGADIGSYYQGALAKDPRLPAINRNISGQIAPDVRNQIAQAAAERGVGVGSYGGGNDQSSMLRALGLTSMGITNQGISQYGDAYNSVPKLDPTSLFVNPTTIFNDTASLRDLNLKLAAEKNRLASEERRFYANLNQNANQFGASMGNSNSRFNTERADTLSARSKEDARLQGIIDRNSGGGSGSGTGGAGSSYTGGSPGTTVGPSPFQYGGSAYGGIGPTSFDWEDPGVIQTSDPYWDNPSTGYAPAPFNAGPSEWYNIYGDPSQSPPTDWTNPNTPEYWDPHDYYDPQPGQDWTDPNLA